MQKVIFGVVVCSLAIGMGYWTWGRQSSCEKACIIVPTEECTRCEKTLPTATQTEQPTEVVEVIDLSPVYESKPTEEEPPLAEFDATKVGGYFVPASFPLARELQVMELMPYIPSAEGEEEAETPDVMEVLPMPKPCMECLPMPTVCDDMACCCDNPLLQAFGTVVSRFVRIEVSQYECDDPRCSVAKSSNCKPVKGSVKVGFRISAEEEQENRGIEVLPMPRHLADPATIAPKGRGKVDTMEVRPTDLPTPTSYPFPY